MTTRSPLASHQSAPAASLSSGSGGNNHYSVGRHRPVGAEAAHIVSQNLADQSRSLVIPITLGGIRGAITARFIDFRSLHGGSYGD